MKLINIGFGNMVSAGRLIAVVSPESAPIKRMVQEARDRGVLIDATYGRRTRAVLIMDSDHIVLSALPAGDGGGPAGRQGGPCRGRGGRGMSVKKKTRGQLIVLSGPSGVGKSTVISELLGARRDIYFSVSSPPVPKGRGGGRRQLQLRHPGGL